MKTRRGDLPAETALEILSKLYFLGFVRLAKKVYLWNGEKHRYFVTTKTEAVREILDARPKDIWIRHHPLGKLYISFRG